MSKQVTNTDWVAVLRGLLYMKLCELNRVPSLVRMAIACGVVGSLTLLAVTVADGLRFWEVAGEIFAVGFLPLFCLVKGGESLRNELKEGTIEYLWTRPTRKAALFGGLYMSSLLGIFALAGSCALGVCLVGLTLGEISILQAVGYLLTCTMLSTAFAAVASALGAFTSKFIVVGVLYYSFVERLLGQMQTSARMVSIIAHAKDMLEGIENGFSAGFFYSFGSMALITGIALAVGATLFTLRQYNVGGDK